MQLQQAAAIKHTRLAQLNANDQGCNSCASLAGLVLCSIAAACCIAAIILSFVACFIACFILLVIAPLQMVIQPFTEVVCCNYHERLFHLMYGRCVIHPSSYSLTALLLRSLCCSTHEISTLYATLPSRAMSILYSALYVTSLYSVESTSHSFLVLLIFIPMFRRRLIVLYCRASKFFAV